MAGIQEESYDVFIVHTGADENKAQIIKAELVKRGKSTFAHYEDFNAGKPVVDNIQHAVKVSKTVLILLTKTALDSNWVLFEALMGLEKAHREDVMCVRIVLVGLTEDEKTSFLTGALKSIPSIDVDFNKQNWANELVQNIDTNMKMTVLLPGGSVAHGLVFNHYIGYLVYVLPATREEVQKTEYFKQGKFSQKYVIIIPKSCKIQPLNGQFDDILIEKMPKTIDMDVAHGDKRRKYNPVVYKVTKKGSAETYFFTGDIPFILGTMSKMKELGFVDIDLRLQSAAFSTTLQELVSHRSPDNKCRGTVNIITYDDSRESFALSLWQTLEQEFNDAPKAETNVLMTKGHLEDQGTQTATITCSGDLTADKEAALEIEDFLKTKNVTFANGDGKSHLTDLENSRWKIFILSEDSIRDGHIAFYFKSALEKSISDNLVQVIPVLARGSDLNNIPFNFRWTTLLKQTEPNYLEKLWKAMREEKTMSDFQPAGVLFEGLAYAYLLNYMCFHLIHKTPSGRDFKERFKDAVEKYCKGEKCICVPRVFVIVPKSCSCPPPGSQFEREIHLRALEPVEIGPRKYFLQLYQLTMSDGQKVCYAREYATPAIALHDMHHDVPFSGVDKLHMNEQARKFAEFSNTIMQNPEFNEKIGKVCEKCSILYFDDEEMGKEGVLTVLEEELKKNISEGNSL